MRANGPWLCQISSTARPAAWRRLSPGKGDAQLLRGMGRPLGHHYYEILHLVKVDFEPELE